MRRLAVLSVLAFALAAVGDDKPLGPREAQELRQQYERQLKDFQDSIDKAKDDPEAREALEKARDEFKKSMEGKVKEAEKVAPPAPAGPGPADPNFRKRFDDDAFRDLEEFQKQMLLDQMRMMEQLRRPLGQPFPQRTRIGVELAAMPAVLVEQMGLDKNIGVVVAAVAKDSAAEKAGLKANDVLLQIAGKDVSIEPSVVVGQLLRAEPGSKLELTVLRKGKKEKIEALEVPAAPQRPPVAAFGGGVRSVISVSVNNGETTISGTFDGNLRITAKGTQEEGAFKPEKITVKDGDEKEESYDSLEKVPEKYRKNAERLLAALGTRRR